MADLSLKYTQPNTFAVATGQGTPFLSTTSMSSELGDIATEVPLVSNVDTGVVSVEPAVQPNQTQMAKMALYGSLNPLKVGILDGYAQRVAQDMDEKVIEAGAAQGKQTADQIDKMVDERVALANKLNQLGQQLAKTPNDIKVAQDRLKAIQEGRLNLTEREVSPERYYSAVDKFVQMQQQAPQAPTLQKPQLAVEDQALIFLAGLAGGIQAVPQALQGAVAGAQQRAQLANQQAQYQYEQEQQNYNRQLQAQQTLLGKEATMLNEERARASRDFTAAQTRSIAEERLVADSINRLKGDAKDKVKGLYTSYLNAAKTAKVITAKDNENIKKFQDVAVGYGMTRDEAEATFPFLREGETELGSKIRNQERMTQAKIDQIASVRSIAEFKTVQSAYDNIFKNINYDKELTEAEAAEANRYVQRVATAFRVDRSLLPVFVAGEAWEKQKFDETFALQKAREVRVMQMAEARLALAREKEARIASGKEKEDKVIGGYEKTLDRLYRDLAGLKAKYNSSTPFKQRDILSEVNQKQAEIEFTVEQIDNRRRSQGINPDTGIIGRGMGEKEMTDNQKEAGQGKSATPPPAKKATIQRPPALQGNLVPVTPTPEEIAGAVASPTASTKKEAQGPFLTPEQRAKLQPQKPKNTGVTASGVKYRR